MAELTLHGRFIWHELMTTDTRSAGRFFSAMTGWTTQAWPYDKSYTVFMAGKERPVAGLMLLPESAKAMGVPPCWVTYIGTPDVQDTVARARALGARLQREPETMPHVGTFASLQDPQGASFVVYTPETDMSSDAPPTVGEFSWHELATTDYKAALTFYQQLFGWEDAGAMDMGAGLGVYQMFGRGGRPIGGIFTKPANMPGPAFWLPYIHVRDARQVAAAVTRAKASVINGPMEVPGGDWIAQGMDLQGAVFAVHSVKEAADAVPAKPAASPRRSGRAAKAGARRGGPATRAAKKKIASTRKAAPARKGAGRKKRTAARPTSGSARKAGATKKKTAARKAKRRAVRPARRARAAKKRSRR